MAWYEKLETALYLILVGMVLASVNFFLNDLLLLLFTAWRNYGFAIVSVGLQQYAVGYETPDVLAIEIPVLALTTIVVNILIVWQAFKRGQEKNSARSD